MAASLHAAAGSVSGTLSTSAGAVASETGVSGLSFDGRTLLLVGVSGLSKVQAEELLDWLEANHAHLQQVSCQSQDGFSVVYG